MKHRRTGPMPRFAALSAGIAAVLASAVAAGQDTPEATEQQTTTLDRIEVTGTRIRRVDAETASPVFTLNREQIEATGAVNVGDFLQQTPAISGAATNPQVNNGGGGGAATVSLRGLGPQRTLVLINGRRLQTQDVNAIPINMVERVEVLKDGASAIYGSDAIGGVVNFILRRGEDGATVTTTSGISSRGDGAQTGASLTIGRGNDRGSLIVGLDYNKQGEIRASDRDHSRAQFFYYYGEIFELGSSRTPNGYYLIPRSVAAASGVNVGDAACGTGNNVAVTRIEGASGSAGNDFRCYNASTDTYNFQEANINMTPQERLGLFANGDFAITDNAEAYVEAFYSKTESNNNLAAEPFDGRPPFAGVTISADNIYNPFGVDIEDARLRLISVGPRQLFADTQRFRSVLGLKGYIGDSSWSWDVGWVYGHTLQTTASHGPLQVSKIAAALGPSFIDADGVPRCGTPGNVIAGCIPVNFFGPAPAPGTPEAGALQAIAPWFQDRLEVDLNVYYASVTGDLFEMPGGMAALAFGVESTRESSSFRADSLEEIDPVTGSCDSSGNCNSSVFGSLSRDEIFGELYLPILSDMPFAERLSLTLGSRYSDYSAFGETTNSKVGVEWKPISDLLLRGTFAEVFRSPTIANLFSPPADSAPQFNDPCNGTTTNPNNACENVPLDGSYQQTDTQVNSRVGGNPDLQPEQGWVRTLGFVYSPSWAEGLSLAADFWHVKLEDNIGALGASNILALCYNAGTFCDKFSRNAQGEVNTVDDRLVNPGRLDTKGVDFSIKHAFPDTHWGTFRTSLDTTYIATFDRQILVDGVVIDFDDFAGEFADLSNGGEGNFARWRALGNLDWNRGDWSASYTARYIHHVDEQGQYSGGLICGPTSGCPDGPTELRVPSILYHDLAVSYAFPMGTPGLFKVTLGVDNVTDKTAPLIFGGFNGSTDVRTYDTIGRFYWLRAEARF